MSSNFSNKNSNYYGDNNKPSMNRSSLNSSNNNNYPHWQPPSHSRAPPQQNMMNPGLIPPYMPPGGMRMPYTFKCPECSITKNSSEDLEIHIKTEHLNWFPFHCPFCTACRASDSQMREHIHSHHKKNENKYLYVDNPFGKRMLQEMMDRALFGASMMAANMTRRGGMPPPPPQQYNPPGFLNGNASLPQSQLSNMDRANFLKRTRIDEFLNSSPPAGADRDDEMAGEMGQQKPQQRLGVTANIVTRKIDVLAKVLQQGALGRGADESGEIGGDDLSPAGSATASEKPPQLRVGGDDEDGGSGGEMYDEEAGGEGEEPMDDFTNSQLSNIFGTPAATARHVKSEFDQDTPPKLVRSGNEMNDLPDEQDDNSHAALQNVAALFSAGQRQPIAANNAVGYGANRHPARNVHNANANDPEVDDSNNWVPRKRLQRRKLGLGTSKRRVLGCCNKCGRPVTAGARQMHVFFHLGKDHGTYRFRCRWAGCDVEHYRKDQMESHQSKMHGKIDAEMMEDRTLELYAMSQKMSMELLGTTGNTPGPTAAKAQEMYESMQKQESSSGGFRKRRRPVYEPKNEYNMDNSGGYSNPRNSFGGQMNGGEPGRRFSPSDYASGSAQLASENLECLLCHKYIMSRIRGFHILWHLNNDLGIIRYGCRHCDFKHDRPQSIANHGKREHNDEECCEDLLNKYEDEVKSMSKACFGVEKIFAKEIRRRSRMERDDPLDQDGGANYEGDEYEDAPSNDEAASYDDPLKPSTSVGDAFARQFRRNTGQSVGSSQSQQQQSAAAKRKPQRSRQFGKRRPKSRKRREEVQKLREISMRLGGAQYFRKRGNVSVNCEKCGKFVANRLSDHAYGHLEGCDLFRCQQCNMGHYSRETIVRHLKDFHSSQEQPIDNRLKFATEIKQAIKECYPDHFIDAPVPTKEDIEKLKKNLKLTDRYLAASDQEQGVNEGGEQEDDEVDADNEEDEMEEGENDNESSTKSGGEMEELEREEDSGEAEGETEENEEEAMDNGEEEEHLTFGDGMSDDGDEQEEGEYEDE